MRVSELYGLTKADIDCSISWDTPMWGVTLSVYTHAS